MEAVQWGKRSRIRAWGITGGTIAVLLALTGCLNIQTDVTVNSDAKGTGTFAISLQKQAAKLMGMNDLNSFKSGINQDSTPGAGNALADAKCEPSETSDSFVMTCSFTDAEFVKPDELFTLTKSNNQIVFQMKNSPSAAAGATAGADAGQLTDLLGGGSLGDVTVNVTFPGPIQSLTGKGATKTSDNSATVTGAMTDTYDVTITSATSTGPPIGAIIGAVVGVLLLAAIVVGLIVFLVRRGKKQSAPELPPLDPALAATGALGAGAAAAGATAVESTVVDTAVVESTVVETPTEVIESVEAVTETIPETLPEAPPPVEPEPPAVP